MTAQDIINPVYLQEPQIGGSCTAYNMDLHAYVKIWSKRRASRLAVSADIMSRATFVQGMASKA